jgi:uncharacterized protein DUF4232
VKENDMKLISKRDGAFVWGSSVGDGFAGGAGYALDITNEGRHACSLRGAPGVAVRSSGHLIGGKIAASGKGPLVIYLPGQRQAQGGWLNARACPGVPIGKLVSPGTIKPGVGVPLYNS